MLRHDGETARAGKPTAELRQYAGQGIEQSAFAAAVSAEHRPDIAGTALQVQRCEQRSAVAVEQVA